MKARSWFLPRDTGGEAFIPRGRVRVTPWRGQGRTRGRAYRFLPRAAMSRSAAAIPVRYAPCAVE